MTRKYDKKASKEVEQSIQELKEEKLCSGTAGKKVKSQKQAVAKDLSKVRKKGAKDPAPRKTTSTRNASPR
jgi:hypothetical protein